MVFDLAPPAASTAWLFPGQGAHGPRMLDPFRDAPGFAAHYHQVCTLLGEDAIELAGREPGCLQRNDVSSLLTVLASVACLELLRARYPSFAPAAVAGYSVGQWTALHAAGAMSAQDLFRIVAARARIMDRCLAGGGTTGMLAVIGVRLADLEGICHDISLLGELLEIANHNAPGQYTLAGSVAGLDRATERLAALRPKRLLRLAVAGAWHTRLLDGAVAPLADVLERVAIAAPSVPVIDNTTGDWLPQDEAARRAALARQVARPVLWMQGIATLAASGIQETLEVGYGDVLTKFNVFIDRSLRHRAASPLPRT